MTLSQSAVSELLDACRAGDGVDLIRESVRLVSTGPDVFRPHGPAWEVLGRLRHR